MAHPRNPTLRATRLHDERDCREILDEDDWPLGHHNLVEIWEVPGTTFVLACVVCGQNAVHTRGPQVLRAEDGTILRRTDGRAETAPGMSIWLTCRGLYPLCRSARCLEVHLARRQRRAPDRRAA